ncbi:hypothetical protein VKT23_016868 [Stygiomarasmius scandens]|uniref:N-acetyltransferase domain-containing protein n=1 Tax=Marasmiellus scandens TaxID=2682957 RepID=A0ABR1IWK2_9AGAR
MAHSVSQPVQDRSLLSSETPGSKPKQTFNVREITEDELEKVCWVVSKAFLDDRVASFCGGFTEYPKTRLSPEGMKVHHMYSFIVKSCFYSGGRIVVATATSESTTVKGQRPGTPPSDSAKQKGEEVITAVICWEPPSKRVNIWNVPLTIRSGGLHVLKGSGISGFMRILDFMSLTEKTHKGAFKDSKHLKKVGNKTRKMTPDDAWYLMMVMTVKEFEGQGCLSLLVREGYSYAQSVASAEQVPFILESSSVRSRDRYAHLGFEIENQPKTVLGRGKFDSRGWKLNKEAISHLKGKNKDAERESTGVEYWCMVNWDPQAPKRGE